jgi:hypothetical protein
MKQTAVEWLLDSLDYNQNMLGIKEILEKAKLIEKEQIVEAYCNGCLDITKDENIFPRETSEQYYNEIYKSE